MEPQHALEHSKEMGRLKSEVHTLNTLVGKLFEKSDALYAKMDSIVEEVRPKPMGAAKILGVVVSILTGSALVFGSVIYIANATNAPLYAQMQALSGIAQQLSGTTQQNTTMIQLASQELTGVSNQVSSTESTLQWILFNENIPKQVTDTIGRVRTLEEKVLELQLKINGGN